MKIQQCPVKTLKVLEAVLTARATDDKMTKLVRQNNRPPELCLIEEDIQDLAVELFPEEEELPLIQYCETCQDFSCECDKMVPCDCGALYHIDEPYGMCFTCEMAQRRQDLIDQENYPDDIPERYDSH
jgi:hypothetical protein